MVAASKDDSYLNGVTIDGTGLEDSGNQDLPTSRAKRTNLLTVWRRVHLEVDSMTTVGNNVTNGRVRDAITIGSSPVWVDVAPFTGNLEPSRFQGGEMTSGTYRFEVLDNTEDQLQIQYNNGNATLFYNSLFQLFDDDDFNDDDGSPPLGDETLDGDDGEDVTYRCPTPVNCDKFSETFSRLQPSTDVNLNPFAAAYVEPSYTWAQGQTGMNDENAPFRLEIDLTANTYPVERPIVNEMRDSTGLESDDFWIGYILIGYQSGRAVNFGNISVDGDPLDYINTSVAGGASPTPTNSLMDLVDSATSTSQVPPGSIGSIVYIEGMRDHDDIYNALSNPPPNIIPDFKVRTVPHEVGHQFGLLGDDPFTDHGLMSVNQSLTLVPTHINVIRWRVRSPGIPNP